MPSFSLPAPPGAHAVPTALSTQVRVVSSMLLREARVRHGRSRLGYAWAIIEPASLVVFLTLLFSEIRGSATSGSDFALFFATGVLPFAMFRTTSQFSSNGIEANRPLFNYPPVQPVDAIIARAILEVCTSLIVMALVLSFLVAALDAPDPAAPLRMAQALALMASFAFGTALCLAAAREYLRALSHIYAILMGPAFLLSGVFYSLQAVPAGVRDVLVWNPLIHGVEGFRSGYLPGYRAPDVDLVYLGCWAFGAVFLGMASTLTLGKRSR